MSIKHITFDDSASMAYYQITSSYQTLLTLTDDADIIWLYNTTTAEMAFKVPSGANTTKVLLILPGCSMCIDARGNSKRVAKGTIQVKIWNGNASIGSVSVTVAR